jgi:phage gpG-like protein
MAAEFGSFAALAEHLAGKAAEMPMVERQALETAAVVVERRAKAKIGHEQHDWPPLAESTIAEKQRLGYAVPAPLLREGDLRASIGHRIDGLEAQVGSDDPKAVWHEFGTSKMSARSFLGSAAIEKTGVILTVVGAAYAAALGAPASRDAIVFTEAAE